MIERKRRTKKAAPAAEPDAFAKLEAADATLADTRKRLSDLRSREREISLELSAVANRIRDENVAAGRAGRDPEGIAEGRARMEQLAQDAGDVSQRITGAEQAVTDAVHARTRVMLDEYPAFAARLDANEQALVDRRAKLEAELAQLDQDEAEHRSAWTELLTSIPFLPDGVSFLPVETIGTVYSGGAMPAPTLRPYLRPDRAGDGLLANRPFDESWPSWLQAVWHSEYTDQQHAGVAREGAAPAMAISAARFDG